MRLLFHDPLQYDKPDDRCATDLCKYAVRIIDNAQTSVDFAFYGVRNQSALFNAIVNAQKRGVLVRGVVDKDSDGNSYYHDTFPLIAALGSDNVRDDYEHDRREAAYQRMWDPEFDKCERPFGFEGPLQCLGYRVGGECIVSAHASREPLKYSGDIMHNKFIVADGRYVWTGSTNASDSGTGGYNANIAGMIDSTVVAGWYTEEFEQMFEGRFHKDKAARPGRRNTVLADGTALELYFTPQDDPIESAVRPLLQKASRSIDIAVFFLTHKFITKDLIEAHERGVKVRIILDANGARNGYTKHEILRLAGIPVKVENWGSKMHMKTAVVDGEHIVMGSMNWTSAGERTNDENTLIVHSKKKAKEYQVHWDKMWTAIPDQWLTANPDPESPQSIHSCTDGSDNDHDHLRDAEDPGCGDNPPPLPDLPPVSRVQRGKGANLVKAVKDDKGDRLFLTYGAPGYEDAWINEEAGEEWFCSQMEAEAAGWKMGWEQRHK